MIKVWKSISSRFYKYTEKKPTLTQVRQQPRVCVFVEHIV